MKIAIISDLHDNLKNIKTFFEMIKKEDIKNIICCGDLSNQESLKKLANKKIEKIYLILGNVDFYEEKDVLNFKNIVFLKRFGIVEIEGLKIGICHEPGFFKSLFSLEKELDFIFYGHTHRPWESMQGKTRLINPGTLGGVFQKPSFAILETETKEVKLKLLHL